MSNRAFTTMVAAKMHPSWNRAKVQSHFGSCGNISKLWNIRDAAYNNTENFIIYFDEE